MKKPEILPATEEILHEFYGDIPMPSMRAFVAKDEGKVIALFGLYYQPESMVLFSDIKPEARKFKKSILACAKKVLGMAKERGVPVYAAADEKIDGSGQFLERIGFVCNAYGVYKWQTQ